LRWAASLERANEHPLASAIVSGATERRVTLAPAESFSSITGQGVETVVDGTKIAFGNRKLMDTTGVDIRAFAQESESMRADGQTVMYLAADANLAGLIGVADPIKASTPDAIRQLHRMEFASSCLRGTAARPHKP